MESRVAISSSTWDDVCVGVNRRGRSSNKERDSIVEKIFQYFILVKKLAKYLISPYENIFDITMNCA